MTKFFLLLIAAITPGFAFAQDNAAKLLSDLETKASLVKVSSDDPSIKNAAVQLVEHVRVLKANSADGSSPDYISTLKLDLKAIDTTLHNSTNSENQQILIAEKDLARKALQSQKASGITATLAPRVKVTVETRSGGTVVNDYLVAANPMLVSNEKPPRFPFPNPTSPTTQALAPGEYSMWLIKDGKEMERREVPIGGDGEITQRVVFDVP